MFFTEKQIISAFVFLPFINVHTKKTPLIKWLGKSVVSCGFAHKADVEFMCVPAKK